MRRSFILQRMRMGLCLGLIGALAGCGRSTGLRDASAVGAVGGQSGVSSAMAGSGGGAGAGGGGGQAPDASVDTAAAGTGGAGVGGAGAGGADAAVDAGSAPGPFMLVSPEDTPLETAGVVLTWTAAMGADSYEVELSSTDSFDDGATKRLMGVVGTTATWPAALQPGLLFHWRVTAVNRGGRTVASNARRWMSAPVGVGFSAHAVAATSDGKALVTSNDMPSGVAVFDLATATTSFIPLTGGTSHVVVASRDGRRAFVSQWGGGAGIAVVNLQAMTLVRNLDMACVGDFSYGLTLTSDGATVLVPGSMKLPSDGEHQCSGGLALQRLPVDGSAMPPPVPLHFDAAPYGGVAELPDGKGAISADGYVTRVDFGTGTATAVAGARGVDVAVTPDGKTAWLAEGEAGGVRPLDLATNTLGTAVAFPTDHHPGIIALTPDGKTAVVAGQQATSTTSFIAVIDLASSQVVRKYPIMAFGVAISPDGRRALATGYGAGQPSNGALLYVIGLK